MNQNENFLTCNYLETRRDCGHSGRVVELALYFLCSWLYAFRNPDYFLVLPLILKVCSPFDFRLIKNIPFLTQQMQEHVQCNFDAN